MKYKLYSLFIFSLLIFFSSCKKEEGCTDPNAINYNSDAQKDDGSCMYPVEGCTNPFAINYDFNATQDNGSCILAVDMAKGIWNVNPACDSIEIPLLGSFSLDEQIPEQINVQASGNDILYIDLDGTQVEGTIDNQGDVNIPSQDVQIDMGFGAMTVNVSGYGTIFSDVLGQINLKYIFEIPLLPIPQSVDCVIELDR